ncbi:hypothetical protein [Halomonas sp. BMC6]|uniref:hypothetical protein n=1 Tax=Halomonas sp. BMC6 TaxID=3073244 RepID=UPI0030CB5C61
MKLKILAIYLAAAFIYGLLSWGFGNYGYKSLAYNLGRGLMWPINIFENSTELDSTNDTTFITTYQNLQLEHKSQEGIYKFNEAIAKIMFNTYAKNNQNFTLSDYKEIENGSLAGYSSANDMLVSLFTNNRLLVREFREYVDGMSLIDVINAGNDAHNETLKILSTRPTRTQSIESCIDSKIAAHREELGEEALVRHDMLEEWRTECSD